MSAFALSSGGLARAETPAFLRGGALRSQRAGAPARGRQGPVTTKAFFGGFGGGPKSGGKPMVCIDCGYIYRGGISTRSRRTGSALCGSLKNRFKVRGQRVRPDGCPEEGQQAALAPRRRAGRASAALKQKMMEEQAAMDKKKGGFFGRWSRWPRRAAPSQDHAIGWMMDRMIRPPLFWPGVREAPREAGASATALRYEVHLVCSQPRSNSRGVSFPSSFLFSLDDLHTTPAPTGDRVAERKRRPAPWRQRINSNTGDVIAQHHHLGTLGDVDVAGDIGGAHGRTVVGEERGVASPRPC